MTNFFTQAIKIILLVLLPCTIYGQDLSGLYSLKSNYDASVTMELRDGRFTQRTFLDFGKEDVSKGYYWFIKDTIFFYHDNRVDTSKCRITQKNKLTDTLGTPSAEARVSIHIANYENNPINVLLLSDNRTNLKGLIPDTNGNLRLTLNFLSGVQFILVSTLGDQCEIPVINLFGYSTQLEVEFSNDAVNQSEHTGLEKYLLHRKRKIVTLKSIGHNGTDREFVKIN